MHTSGIPNINPRIQASRGAPGDYNSGVTSIRSPFFLFGGRERQFVEELVFLNDNVGSGLSC